MEANQQDEAEHKSGTENGEESTAEELQDVKESVDFGTWVAVLEGDYP